MAIPHISESEEGPIQLDGDQLVLSDPLRLIVPSTVEMLRSLPPEGWKDRLTKVLEAGTGHFRTADASATIQVIDERMARIFDTFQHELTTKWAETLQADRELGRKQLSELFAKSGEDLRKAVGKYADPNAPDALPALIGQRLAEAHKAGLRGIDEMLQDGDKGVLAKQTAAIVKVVREEMELLKRQVVERQTAHDLGIVKGATFEEALAGRLGIIARPLLGDVERVANTLGLKRSKEGDLLLTVNGPLTRGQAVSVVFEAKDHNREGQAFSLNAVRQACEQACANRGANRAVFVASSPELLPEGRGFGVVDGHYWVAWPRSTDDTVLAVVVHVAITQAVQDLSAHSSEERSFEAARREVSALLALLERFDQVESGQNSAIRSIRNAAGGLGEIREALRNRLSRLGSLLEEQ